MTAVALTQSKLNSPQVQVHCDVDTPRLRRDLYLGPGYHIIRGYCDSVQVQSIAAF